MVQTSVQKAQIQPAGSARSGKAKIIKPAPRAISVAKLMKALQAKVQGGDVRLTLGNGQFFAHCFPSQETAQALVIAEIKKTSKQFDSVNGFTEAHEVFLRTPLAVGRGKTPEEALSALEIHLKTKPEVERNR